MGIARRTLASSSAELRGVVGETLRTIKANLLALAIASAAWGFLFTTVFLLDQSAQDTLVEKHTSWVSRGGNLYSFTSQAGAEVDPALCESLSSSSRVEGSSAISSVQRSVRVLPYLRERTPVRLATPGFTRVFDLDSDGKRSIVLGSGFEEIRADRLLLADPFDDRPRSVRGTRVDGVRGTELIAQGMDRAVFVMAEPRTWAEPRWEYCIYSVHDGSDVAWVESVLSGSTGDPLAVSTTEERPPGSLPLEIELSKRSTRFVWIGLSVTALLLWFGIESFALRRPVSLYLSMGFSPLWVRALSTGVALAVLLASGMTSSLVVAVGTDHPTRALMLMHLVVTASTAVLGLTVPRRTERRTFESLRV